MQKRNFLVFILLFSVGFFAYKDCFSVFIPADNYTEFIDFKDNIIVNFNDLQKSVLFVFSMFLIFSLFKVFGVNAACWISTAIVLHCINSFILYLIAKAFCKHIRFTNGVLISFTVALLFLISPYQTEVVLWAPTCTVMLFATAFLLASLLCLINYLESNKISQLLPAHLLFLLAVFSYESTLMMPGIVILIYILLKKIKATTTPFKQFIKTVLLPQCLILFSYLLLSKLILGKWLWHGGSIDVLLPFYSIAGTLLKYFAKFFLFYRYLPLHTLSIVLRDIYSNHLSIILLFGTTTFLAVVVFLYTVHKKNESGWILVIMFLCFLVALVPVLPLDSSFLKYIYPDRYGYLPSAFFYLFISLFAFSILKKLAAPVMLSYTLLCWVLLMQTLSAWNDVNLFCNKLITNYKPLLKYDQVYVLNIPGYYKGIAAFRSAFPETIYFKYGATNYKNIEPISTYYYESRADSIKSISIKDTVIEVIGQKKASPFFGTGGGWSKSYRTEKYAVKYSPDGSSYTVTFKDNLPAKAIFVYEKDGDWKILNQ